MPVSGRPPLLVMVTDCAAESWPSGVAAKASGEDAGGLSVSVGAAPPVPLSCDGLRSRSVRKRELTGEGACCVGANSTCNGQSVLAARLWCRSCCRREQTVQLTETLADGDRQLRLALATVIVAARRQCPPRSGHSFRGPGSG